MKIQEQAVDFAGEELILTNQRVVYWPVENMLMLSDLHVGKAAHFRKSGIALPEQIARRDMDRLQVLIEHYQPEKVLIVGDLLHAGMNTEVLLLKELIVKSDCQFLLVKGNHDRLADHKFEAMKITVLPADFHIREVCFAHGDRAVSSVLHTVCGHFHPGVQIRIGRKSTMRFPCFVLAQTKLILPAFSLFSGLDTRCIPPRSSCYAIYEDGLFQVSC